MSRKDFLKSGIRLILRDPRAILNLFTFNFDRFYYLYWKPELEYSKKLYEDFNKNSSDDSGFLQSIKEISSKILKEKYSEDTVFHILLYLIIRKLKPKSAIETGVSHGVSSLFILQALNDNKQGALYSIDLPLANYVADNMHSIKSNVPPEKVGVCVPSTLRKRWNLILDDSKKELPTLLENLQSVDFFLHDSKHTYEHMLWEYEKVWPYLKTNGILVSDDTNLNDAFKTFVANVECENIQLQRRKIPFGTFGIILKNQKLT